MAHSYFSSQVDATEAYRRSPYPALIHPLTHPDRLATIARLAGMTPPDIRTARVLEIGVGDGLNTLSMAQTLPGASFVGFDIDPDAIARGRARVTVTRLGNISLVVADLLDEASLPDGSFDYIVAHGVYAWVPEAVADAVLALIGARLSPNGVAFISFNTLPGCFSRIPLRNAILRASDVATDAAERLARTRAMLELIAAPHDDDTSVEAGWRGAARYMLARDPDVLLHDELGAEYRPRYLHEVLDRARSHRLAFLGDASHEQVTEAVLTDDDIPPEARQGYVEARVCTSDDLAYRTFRRVLLIREAAVPTRRLDPRGVEELYAQCNAREEGDGEFVTGIGHIRCAHPVLAAMLRRLIAAYPARIPVRDLELDDNCLAATVDLFDQGIVGLHTVGTPAALSPPDPPIVSPVARAMIAEGAQRVPNLSHQIAALDAGAARAAMMLDGSIGLADARVRMAAESIDPDIVFAGLTAQRLLLP